MTHGMDASSIDLIVLNARVWNGNGSSPRLSHLLIGNQRVLDIVTDTASLPSCNCLDVQHAVITPGFVDAHLHLTLGAETLLHVDLSEVDSREAFEARIEHAHLQMDEGQWLIAAGWDESSWGGSSPDRNWLRSAGDRPVVCWRCDHHAVLVNEPVLRCLSAGDFQKVLGRGRVLRGQDGEPTGVLLEAAAWELINPLVPRLPEAARAEAIVEAHARLLKAGVTAVRTMEYQRDLNVLMAAGEGPRTAMVILDRTAPIDLDWSNEISRTDSFGIVGYKAFLDGTIGSRTARLRCDYTDDPGNRGLWLEHAADGTLSEWSRHGAEHDLEPAMHAIGDAAVDLALDVVADVDGPPAVIEHAELIPEDVLPRLAGVHLSVQPTHRAEDAMMSAGRLGQRSDRILPLRDMFDAGGVISFGTDWPIVPFDPLRTLRSAVLAERADGVPFVADQAVKHHEAFFAATHAGADRCGFERSLLPGGPADFLVWQGDPFEDLHTASVQATFMNGTLVSGGLQGDDHGRATDAS